ncbi:AIM24 family protein [Clostridium chromiireducens]|uniref:AIM24 family protein n=1 Tax=Clostridium chromiireducens TaxID=225345 RepID=A0A964RJJ0_9CLOT|nr:AIM24 family protein [Clostridium chromiireducens]MVX62793.1 AIM24 family protein [Clostridium chromiireducens]
MRSSLKFTNKLSMLSEMECESKFQILQYENLDGATDVQSALGLNIMKESGIKLKQIRIILEDSSVRLEPGSLSYMKGTIEVRSKQGGLLGFGKKIISSKLTGETVVRPTYSGTGEIFLEPSFGHFALIELEDDEIIISDNMFYACEEGIEVSAAMQKNVSSALLGNEGLYQTRLDGSGIVVLKIPVPETEIFKCILINDTLKVDGNLAILRTGNIEFSVEKSSKSIIGTAVSGEGIVNVYRGTGEVWLMPTRYIYKDLCINDNNRLRAIKYQVDEEDD